MAFAVEKATGQESAHQESTLTLCGISSKLIFLSYRYFINTSQSEKKDTEILCKL